VISDRNILPNNKVPVVFSEILPDLAILDPEMTSAMPPNVTANTGIDALSHAVECYTSKVTNDFADGFALHAIRLIFEYLPRVYCDGTDLEARARMQYASCLAGMAIANGGTAIVHSLGQVVGVQYGVPHGASMSIFMPYCIEFSAQTIAYRYADIARAVGFQGSNAQEGADWFVKKIRNLQNVLDLPQTIVAAGVSKEDFLKNVDQYTELAFNEGGYQTNGREAKKSELKDLFIQALGE
jgi:alcohol dehydrogenase class IV